ncbi:UNVERIFIED_CONTAM: hypothetical protein HDU68_005182, partial [Siphonaria sp. JEL0065]
MITADSASSYEPLQFDPSGKSASNKMANLIDSDARNIVSDILLKIGIPATPKADFNDILKIEQLAKQLERICIRSQSSFISLVIGHLPFTLVNSLIRILFLEANDPTPSAVETLIHLKQQPKGISVRKIAPKLGHALLDHTDALHQSLLRTSKNIVCEYTSAAPTRLEDQLPCFPVFNQTTGAAIPVFKTRPLTFEELRHPNYDAKTWVPKRGMASPEVTEDSIGSWLPSSDINRPEDGSQSVVPSIAHFKRGLKVFAPGLEDIKFDRNKAILAAKAQLPLNDALFTHFHGPCSSLKNSDLDVFFVGRNRSSGPEQVVDEFWEMFENIFAVVQLVFAAIAIYPSSFNWREKVAKPSSTESHCPSRQSATSATKLVDKHGVQALKCMQTNFAADFKATIPSVAVRKKGKAGQKKRKSIAKRPIVHAFQGEYCGEYCGFRYAVPSRYVEEFSISNALPDSFIMKSDPASLPMPLLRTKSSSINATASFVESVPKAITFLKPTDFDGNEWDCMVSNQRSQKRESALNKERFHFKHISYKVPRDSSKLWRRDRDWIARENKLDKKANWGMSNLVKCKGTVYPSCKEAFRKGDAANAVSFHRGYFAQMENTPEPKYYDRRGWSQYREEGVSKILDSLPIIRTANSITIVGMYPVRHVQLMVNVIRSPEEVRLVVVCLFGLLITPRQLMLSCDLDCTAVFFDGENVFATHRSIRAFNTRKNFVEAPHFQDNSRLKRIVKYASRGFGTTMFEICKHFPRCDVVLSSKYMDILLEVPKRLNAEHWFELFDEKKKQRLLVRRPKNTGGEGDDASDDGSFLSQEEMRFEESYFEYRRRYDYTPASIPYKETLYTYTLKEAINNLDFQPTEDPSKKRVLKILDDATTLASDEFKAQLLLPGDESGNLASLQLKHAKERATRNRVRYALSFESCYMCGTSVQVESNSKVMKMPLCHECTKINTRKRETSIDLTGCFAVVTGARIKIGQEITLRLLRSGCTVYATTRFPLLMINHFHGLEDSHVWRDRLFVHALDVRNVNSVLSFCAYLEQTIPRLDILIQNAAQTIRRTPEYYRPMVLAEIQLSKTMKKDEKLKWKQFESTGALRLCEADDDASGILDSCEFPVLSGTPNLLHTARRLIAESAVNTLTVFPDSLTESAELVALQLERNKSWDLSNGTDPADIRGTTTWTTTLPSVAPSELAEVLIANSISPALLMQRLLPLLSTAKIPREHPSFIVNVTSREGIFNSSASDASGRGEGSGMSGCGGSGVHPHTNMAKAALNRLTQTCAEEYMEQGVCVTAVDPGW